MRDALLIRSATADDEEFARTTHHAAFRDVVVRQFGPWDEARQDGFFAAKWALGGTDIVELDGERCGFLLVDERDDVVLLSEIVLHPSFHGRGIGTELLRGIFERGKPVRLQVLYENHRARALYERLGFVAIGDSGTHTVMERRAA